MKIDTVLLRGASISGIVVAIWALVQLYGYVTAPRTDLVAEIHLAHFTLPFSINELGQFVRTANSQGQPEFASHMAAIEQADGLASISIINDGARVIQNISIFAQAAMLYARLGPGNNVQVLPSTDKGAMIDELRQGETAQVFIWTLRGDAYLVPSAVLQEFRITYPDGIASQRIYIEGHEALHTGLTFFDLLQILWALWTLGFLTYMIIDRMRSRRKSVPSV